MAKTKYDDRTRQQIASDTLEEKGLFGTIGTYLSGDMPRSESRDDIQGKVNRRRKGMETLKQREAEGKRRAARLRREKERQIASNEEARKERVRAREQAKIDRQAASVSGRALNADEKKAIADMKRRERLAQQDSAKASTGVLLSSANPPAKTKPAAAKTPVSKTPVPKAKTTKSTPASSGPEWKKYKSVAAAKRAGSRFYTGADGKKKLAITKEELGRKKGETLTQAYNRVEGKTPRKTSSAASSAKKSETKKSETKNSETKKVGGIRRLLLGSDGKFGGARGAIDFLPGKSRPKKKEPVKKMGGGMMKSKMASKGGARGGRKPMGMKGGGFPDLNKDGKVTQADILQGRGVAKKKAGGMMKSKGMAMGGMMKSKGMKKGGMMKSKGYKKGGMMKSKGYKKGGMMKSKGYKKGGKVK